VGALKVALSAAQGEHPLGVEVDIPVDRERVVGRIELVEAVRGSVDEALRRGGRGRFLVGPTAGEQETRHEEYRQEAEQWDQWHVFVSPSRARSKQGNRTTGA